MKDQAVRREADEVVNPLVKYGHQLSSDIQQNLQSYVNARLAAFSGSLVSSSYEPRVDGGGWRSRGIEGQLEAFHEPAAEIEGLHRHFPPELRAAADALTDAIGSPRRPCPFETFVGRSMFARFDPQKTKEEMVVSTLKRMGEQLAICKKRGGR